MPSMLDFVFWQMSKFLEVYVAFALTKHYGFKKASDPKNIPMPQNILETLKFVKKQRLVNVCCSRHKSIFFWHEMAYIRVQIVL